MLPRIALLDRFHASRSRSGGARGALTCVAREIAQWQIPGGKWGLVVGRAAAQASAIPSIGDLVPASRR